MSLPQEYMHTPALDDLLVAPRRLFPEERAELLFLKGRIARLEVIEADCQALVDSLPQDLRKMSVSSLKKVVTRFVGRR